MATVMLSGTAAVFCENAALASRVKTAARTGFLNKAGQLLSALKTSFGRRGRAFQSRQTTQYL
jgi:hypothetical protein